jgi:hypothetical protein
MVAAQPRRHVRQSQQRRQACPSVGHNGKNTRCQCGKCTMCIDNARWDKIFNAKFADPTYYTSRPVRSGSSLAWVPPATRQTQGPAER